MKFEPCALFRTFSFQAKSSRRSFGGKKQAFSRKQEPGKRSGAQIRKQFTLPLIRLMQAKTEAHIGSNNTLKSCPNERCRGEKTRPKASIQHVTVLYYEKLKLLFDGLTERKMFSRPNFDSDLVFPFAFSAFYAFFFFWVRFRATCDYNLMTLRCLFRERRKLAITVLVLFCAGKKAKRMTQVGLDDEFQILD